MTRLPSLFLSHGAPTFALEPGRAGRLLAALGRRLGKPRAVLVLSPHWMTRTLVLGSAPRPKTLHDFGGFPAELYTLDYPAPGAPGVAIEAARLLQSAGIAVGQDPGRGLDHGVWVPLMHLFPAADVAVVPLAMRVDLDPAQAWQLGHRLAPLAERGVLILGSGSLTHNLYDLRAAGEPGEARYARDFVDWTRDVLRREDRSALLDYRRLAPQARRAHPTPDHYLPLPFAAGAADGPAAPEILDGGMTYGVLSMESYVFGRAPAAEVA